VTSTQFPDWALPVAIDPDWALPVAIDNMQADETMWIYQKGPVVIGFVLDRDGYITNITIAGEKCDYARTALWRPHKYIQLGDSFKRVLYRYGIPDTIQTFDGSVAGTASPGTGIIQVSVSSGGTMVYGRDLIMQYDQDRIAFTLHNMKVTRIQIWR